MPSAGSARRGIGNLVVEELAQHLEDRYQELQGRDLSNDENNRRAVAEPAERDLLARGVRDARRSVAARPARGAVAATGGSMHGLLHDLRIALRYLRMHPAFSVMVVGMLALGIAGNAAIFSIFDG